MKLYRIQRKSDRKYLTSADHKWTQWSGFKGAFTSTGAFWKRIDTVKSHIKVLCSEYSRENRYQKSTVRGAGYSYVAFKRTGYTPERADLYMVECLDVSVDGAELLPAREFLK